jgi:hypothetical protein
MTIKTTYCCVGALGVSLLLACPCDVGCRPVIEPSGGAGGQGEDRDRRSGSKACEERINKSHRVTGGVQ